VRITKKRLSLGERTGKERGVGLTKKKEPKEGKSQFNRKYYYQVRGLAKQNSLSKQTLKNPVPGGGEKGRRASVGLGTKCRGSNPQEGDNPLVRGKEKKNGKEKKK